MRFLIVAAASCTALATPLAAQSVFDTNVRAAPQFLTYQIKAPVNETISEFTTPIFVVIPITSTLTFDVGTAFASASVKRNGAGTEQKSTISGLTDTQIRANLSFGSDFVVVTAGVNIPTGKETATQEELLAAFRIGNDFLAFPISNMGTGFGATGAIAIAPPIGSWNLCFRGKLRPSAGCRSFGGHPRTRPRLEP